MKKKLLSLGLGLASVFALASCGQSSAGKTTETTSVDTGENTDVHEHTYRHSEEKTATYTKKGMIEYYYCKECKKYFDANYNEISKSDIYTDYLAITGKVTEIDENGKVTTDIKGELIEDAYPHEHILTINFEQGIDNIPYVHWVEELADGDAGLLTDEEYTTLQVGNGSFATDYSISVGDEFTIKYYSNEPYESQLRFFNEHSNRYAVNLYGEDISVDYVLGTQDTYEAYAQEVIDAADAETVTYEDLAALYDTFVDKYYWIIDQYHYASIIADSTALSANYDIQTEILSVVNSFEEMDQKIDLAVYDSKYKYDYFAEDGYTTDEEIDAYIATIDVEKTAAANEAYEAMEKYISDYSGKVETSEAKTLFNYYSKSQEYAKLVGYDDYLTYAYKEVYGREYTVEESNELKKYMATYIVPFYESYEEAFNSYYALATGTNTGREQFNQAITLLYNFYGTNFDVLDEYSELIGDDYLENFKQYYISGKYYYSATENDDVTAYVSSYSDGTPFMFMSPQYQGLSTFIHEFGHYNAAMEGGDVVSYDLDEVQSQANETMFALFIQDSGIAEETVLDIYLDIVIYQMAKSVINGYLINELEKWAFTADYSSYTDVLYESVTEYNEAMAEKDEDFVEITEEEFNALSDDEKVKTHKYDIWYKDLSSNWDKICKNVNQSGAMEMSSVCSILRNYHGYYISYATSAVASLEVYALARKEFNESGTMTEAIAAYKKIYAAHDGDTDTFTSVLEAAGLYGVFDEECYKLVATATLE